jgi:hypothetical protein
MMRLGQAPRPSAAAQPRPLAALPAPWSSRRTAPLSALGSLARYGDDRGGAGRAGALAVLLAREASVAPQEEGRGALEGPVFE